MAKVFTCSFQKEFKQVLFCTLALVSLQMMNDGSYKLHLNAAQMVSTSFDTKDVLKATAFLELCG